MRYVYHLCSTEFRGNVLYPLNELRAMHPDLYAREREKYAGRERVLDFIVPRLAVRWADTVNLSALDPRRLVEERRRLGVPFSNFFSRRLLRIPVECIAELPATRYVATTHWLNSRPHDPNARTAPPKPISATSIRERIRKPLTSHRSIKCICKSRKPTTPLRLALSSFLMSS